MYQSTGSLHSDGHSSNSMSPAPSPSPTNLKGTIIIFLLSILLFRFWFHEIFICLFI